MNFYIQDDKIIIQKFLSKKVISPDDIAMIYDTEDLERIILTSGKEYDFQSADSSFLVNISTYAYQYRVPYEAMEKNYNEFLDGRIYSEQEALEVAKKQLTVIREIGNEIVKFYYGEEYHLLMNVNYDAEEWNLSFELTKEGTGDEAFEHLDSLCFFELIRIDPDLRERYFLSFPDFEKDEQGIRECLRDIIEDSNLKKRIKG